MKRLHHSIVLTVCICLLFAGCEPQDAPAANTAASETSALGSFRMEAIATEASVQTSEINDAATSASDTIAESTPSATTAPALTPTDENAPAAAASTTSPAKATKAPTAKTASAASGATTTARETAKAVQTNEIRAIWISYLDFSFLSRDRSEAAYRNAVREMTRRIRDGKMNTVFLQVRPASDAFYRSSLFPYSAYISGTEGKDPGYDALRIFCDYANNANLSVHAWINPFRVGDASNLANKASSNPAKRILTDDDPYNDGRIARANGSLYYDPADRENQDLILDGMRELLQNYPIDGIHIDDYFYPSTDASIDQKDYDAYRAAGGTESRGSWRRTQINALVARMYTTVKSFGQEKIFSISPAMQIDKNRSTMYADVARWAKYGGFCDWLIPQAYVGLEHQTYPFRDVVREWTSLERDRSVRLLFGLSAYKCGTTDSNAGSGSREWIENKDVLSREIRYLRETGESSGFALFSYAYVFGEKMSNNSIPEMKSVIDVL